MRVRETSPFFCQHRASLAPTGAGRGRQDCSRRCAQAGGSGWPPAGCAAEDIFVLFNNYKQDLKCTLISNDLILYSLTLHVPDCSPVAAAATMKYHPKLCLVSRFYGQVTGLL